MIIIDEYIVQYTISTLMFNPCIEHHPLKLYLTLDTNPILFNIMLINFYIHSSFYFSSLFRYKFQKFETSLIDR